MSLSPERKLRRGSVTAQAGRGAQANAAIASHAFCGSEEAAAIAAAIAAAGIGPAEDGGPWRAAPRTLERRHSADPDLLAKAAAGDPAARRDRSRSALEPLPTVRPRTARRELGAV